MLAGLAETVLSVEQIISYLFDKELNPLNPPPHTPPVCIQPSSHPFVK